MNIQHPTSNIERRRETPQDWSLDILRTEREAIPKGLSR